MKIKSTYSIKPPTNMMNVLGHAGYTFNFAIADLIDNCIAAKAKNIEIHFSTKSKEQYIYILDDGEGMDEKKLKEASTPGFENFDAKRNEEDLGRFSTGLNSASKSICSKLIVSSKIKGGTVNSIMLDYDYIQNSNKWVAYEIDSFELENKIGECGTIVYCANLKTKYDDEESFDLYGKIENLIMELSHIYGKYLLSKKFKMTVTINDSKPINVTGWNPFGLVENKTTKTIYEKEIIFNDKIIKVKSYILPVYNNLSSVDQKYMIGKGLIEQEGFYIYRNGRLIQEGGWLSLEGIGADDKSKYARIDVEIPVSLDKEFSVNFSKNSLIIPKELERIFIDIAKKARSESRKSFNFMKHPDLSKRIVKTQDEKIWKVGRSSGGTVLSVNLEHPIIGELCKNMSLTERKRLFNILSKSLPITMIQTQQTQVVSFTSNEIKQLAEEQYNKLLSEGKTVREIKMIFKNMEPFKDYIEYVIEFFDELEVVKNEK